MPDTTDNYDFYLLGTGLQQPEALIDANVIALDDLLLGFEPMSARVHHNATQSISTATSTVLAFNSERWDTDTLHDNSTNNSRLILKKVGLWAVYGHVGYAQNGTGNRGAIIRMNGDDNQRYGATTLVDNGGTALNTVVSVYTEVKVAAITEYAELIAYQESGGSLDVSASTGTYTGAEFGCHFIGVI